MKTLRTLSINVLNGSCSIARNSALRSDKEKKLSPVFLSMNKFDRNKSITFGGERSRWFAMIERERKLSCGVAEERKQE